MTSSDWSHEQIEKLINEYRKNPQLWDPKDNNYHMKNKKNDAWMSIAKNIGCEVTEATKKITFLLSSYRREKTMKKSMGTGKGNYGPNFK